MPADSPSRIPSAFRAAALPLHNDQAAGAGWAREQYEKERRIIERLGLPVIFWQLWGFIAPALYAHEKRYVIPFVVLSSGCFLAGTVFGFQVAFPLMFGFLVEAGTAGGEVVPMLSMGSYLSLAGQMLLAFGITFELPIVILFLARIGVIDYPLLARNRKYALLVCFILGAVFSPPDVVSQTVLAVPMFCLYEVGIWLVFFFGRKKPPVTDAVATTDAA